MGKHGDMAAYNYERMSIHLFRAVHFLLGEIM